MTKEHRSDISCKFSKFILSKKSRVVIFLSLSDKSHINPWKQLPPVTKQLPPQLSNKAVKGRSHFFLLNHLLANVLIFSIFSKLITLSP